MNKSFKRFVAALMVLASAGVFASGGMAFMNEIIYKFEKFRSRLVENYSKETRKKVAAEAREVALGLIDVNEIGKLALGSYYDKVKPSQRDEFTKLFHELMANRVVNAQIPKDKIEITKIPIKINKEKTKKDKRFNKDAVVVLTEVPHKRINYEVDFYLYQVEDTFKLYDIHIDQSSTLLDFRNQFARIIRRKGMSYLLQKLKARLTALNKDNYR